jgi:hypothetical protein
MTTSEKLFENFCEQNKLVYSRLEEDNKRRLPDYFVEIDNYKIIVEVTEFELNKGEKEKLLEFRRKKSGAYWPSTERRIRDEINKKNKQIKPLVIKHNCPSILLIYDNRKEFADIDSDSIKYAMYGEDSHIIHIYDHLDRPPVYIGNKFGGHRKMTKDEKTYISAIGHLFTENKNLKIDLYHNYYSKYPIESNKIRAFSPNQYKIDEPPHKNGQKEWVKV